jgi:hypothetical protein
MAWFPMLKIFLLLILTGREDECETASEVYQCGRDANLPIVDQIYSVEKKDATVVR